MMIDQEQSVSDVRVQVWLTPREMEILQRMRDGEGFAFASPVKPISRIALEAVQ